MLNILLLFWHLVSGIDDISWLECNKIWPRQLPSRVFLSERDAVGILRKCLRGGMRAQKPKEKHPLFDKIKSFTSLAKHEMVFTVHSRKLRFGGDTGPRGNEMTSSHDRSLG
jgi:hypothetical protein